MELSIIIVNYNVYNDVKVCIESIYKYLKSIHFEIIVVDNNSTDRSIDYINIEFKEVKYIQLSLNFGFGFANNIGMKNASGKYFLLVNPDIIFEDNSIQVLYEFISKNDKAGVAGPVQHKPGEGIEYYYTFFPSLYSRLMQENRMYMKTGLMKKRFFDFLDSNISKGKPFEVDWVIASCLMVKRSVYDTIGGFDEAFFLFEEETEWQYRMRNNGWLTYMHPGANVLHYHHSSTSKLGRMFVYYHEFRSRIIFDRKRFRGLKNLIRILMINTGLTLRVFFFFFRVPFNREMKIKLKAYFDLLVFSFKPREALLNSRYDYENKQHIFK